MQNSASARENTASTSTKSLVPRCLQYLYETRFSCFILCQRFPLPRKFPLKCCMYMYVARNMTCKALSEVMELWQVGWLAAMGNQHRTVGMMFKPTTSLACTSNTACPIDSQLQFRSSLYPPGKTKSKTIS